VRFHREDTAVELLKSARSLRNADDPNVRRNVYINPDLAPAAAKLAYEERQRRRQRRSAMGNNEVPRQQYSSDNNCQHVQTTESGNTASCSGLNGAAADLPFVTDVMSCGAQHGSSNGSCSSYIGTSTLNPEALSFPTAE